MASLPDVEALEKPNGERLAPHEAVMGKPPGGYRASDTERRLRWLERHTGRRLQENVSPRPEELRGIIENHVGYVPIPQAIAAPLLIEGTHANGEFAVPLCTVEGTLVLSMTRGMLAIAMAGGCRTVHVRQELSRCPAFILPDVAEMRSFMTWVDENYESIRAHAESTTRHGRLLRIEKYPVQNWLVLDFVYDTGNAAGQNMVTIATDTACRAISEQTGRRYFLESGFNGDKKPTRRNLMSGRGHAVIVEFELPEHVLSFLGITRESVLEFQDMAVTAAQAVGMLGNNLHLANALTAIYLATGQDAACVAENSLAYSQARTTPAGLTCRMTLPSLTVGTVGGGTRLPAQQRNLELLGCVEGPFAARKLAEIIAAAAAAIELSLMAAIVAGDFRQAHQRYGRPS